MSVLSPVSLPRDLIYAELFQRLSISEIYAYCQSSSETVSLCNDLALWKGYLKNYDHGMIQDAVLDAAQENNWPFVRLLMQNAKRLDLTIDQDTLIRSFISLRRMRTGELPLQ